MARKSRQKSNVIRVNFKGVEGRVTVPEGDYHVAVNSVKQEEGQAGDYLSWEFRIANGKFEGKTLYTNTSLAPQALWNLRNLLEAIGTDIPDDEMDVDLSEVIGGELIVTVEHEKYEGRTRARVMDYQAVGDTKGGKKSSDEDEDEDDEDEAPKSRRSRRSRNEDEDEEAPKSKRGRKSRDDDEDEDEAPKSKRSRRSRDEDEDEDDEDEAPKSKRRAKKAKSGVSADDLEGMSEDDLEELVEEHGLDLNLSKAKTLTKKRNLVTDALEEAGLLAA